jgi:X-X-X-Leu-X-X-Gly heptad repeat protein
MRLNSVTSRPVLLTWLAVSVAIAAFAAGGLGAYAMYEHRSAQSVLAQQQQITAGLNQARTQIDELTSKVNALAARPEPQPTPAVETPVAPATVPARRPTGSVRLKKMQSQLDQQGKAITDTRDQLENTRGDLNTTRTELTGSIARTHDEVVLLQKKGERNYYEFDIAKSKQFQHEGPLGVRLRKANTKHQYADLDLIVEDQNLSQKHVNLYQPAMFYTPDNTQPAELVINSITTDHIRGYVSSPKHRQSELASIPNANGAETNQPGESKPGSQPAQRQSLPQPQ